MTDYFAFLGVPRSVLPDEALLKERYLRKAAELHPDASKGDAAKFAQLQEAHRVLGDHAFRLRHLLALLFPGQESSAQAARHPDLFMQVGQAVQAAKTFLQRDVQSPLARALLAQDKQKALRGVREARTLVKNAHETFLVKLRELDVKWPQVTAEELAAQAADATFLSRWETELAEWEFRLAHGN